MSIETPLVTLAVYSARHNYSPLPCDIACPKCGYTDITRKYKRAQYTCKATPILGMEYIDNICQCCQYSWIALPLSQKKQTDPLTDETK